jgi:WD40 repeat protein
VQVSGPLGPVNAVAFSPDGTLLAAGSGDGTILLAHVTATVGHVTATVLAQASGHLGPVEAVAFSPDGHTLASASTDHTVRLWRVEGNGSLTFLATLAGHTQAVISVTFSSDGGTLASSADDHTVRLWDVRNPSAPSLFATLTGLSTATSVAFEPGTHTVVGAALDGTALFWDTGADQVANRICLSQLAGAAPALAPYLRGVSYRPVCPPESRP